MQFSDNRLPFSPALHAELADHVSGLLHPHLPTFLLPGNGEPVWCVLERGLSVSHGWTVESATWVVTAKRVTGLFKVRRGERVESVVAMQLHRSREDAESFAATWREETTKAVRREALKEARRRGW